MGQVPKRPLGNTGLHVSVLGFGASPLGGVFHEVDAEEGKRAVHLAFEKGINFFDTSPFYGDTKSETALGRAIADLPRDEIVVATKVGRYGQALFDFSAPRVKASVDESLQRLGLSYIDLIQCHDMEFVKLDQIVNETLPALLELKKEGKVRHIGITGLPLGIFKYVLDRVPEGTVDCILSYCHYTLCDNTLDDMIPGPPAWHPAPPALVDAAKQASQKADEFGIDIADIALQYSLRNEHIATTLVGMCTPQQVSDNCAAALKALGEATDSANSPAFLDASEVINSILSSTHNTTWPSGLDENNA
eukprot:jgi/Picre1/28032/NNA_000993.t1